MPDNDDKLFTGILYVAAKPEKKPYGAEGNELLKFRGAHTISYGDNGTVWYDVAIFDEVLIESIGEKGLYKGAVVAVEGFVKEKLANDGITVWRNLRAHKVGVIAWFQRRDKNAKKVVQPVTTPAATMPTAEQVAAFLAAQGAAPAADKLPF